MAQLEIYFGLNGANPALGYKVFYRPIGVSTYIEYPTIFYTSPAVLVNPVYSSDGYEGYIEAYCGFQDYWTSDIPEPPVTTTTSTTITSTTTTSSSTTTTTTSCIQPTIISAEYGPSLTTTTTSVPGSIVSVENQSNINRIDYVYFNSVGLSYISPGFPINSNTDAIGYTDQLGVVNLQVDLTLDGSYLNEEAIIVQDSSGSVFCQDVVTGVLNYYFTIYSDTVTGILIRLTYGNC